MNPIIDHYDKLIDENNDPVFDPPLLQEYMDKWDGKTFIEELQLDNNKSILEIGVGTGRLAIRTIPACGYFTGIDISPKTIERANKNLASLQNKTLICIDFFDCVFTEQFDVVYSSLTFLHIKDKQKAFNKVAVFLKKGGRLVLSVSKDQSNELNINDRKLALYPDTPGDTEKYMINSGLSVIKKIETEFAYVFVAIK